MNSKELAKEATKFLRANGFTAGGKRKPFSEKSRIKKIGQRNFERSFISTPAGGQPGYKIRKKPR